MPQETASFQPFTQTHAMVVLWYGVATLMLIALGRWGRSKDRLQFGQSLHYVWLGFVTIVQLVNIVFWCVPPQLEFSSSLPLHICDLMGIITVIALSTEARWSRVLLLYWGLGLSTQGFLYPIIKENPESMRFQIFFLSHFTIIASALYDLLVRRFRVSWVDCAMASLYTLMYLGIILPIDLLAKWNYGYVGQENTIGPINRFGEWPIRVVWLFIVVESGFLILTAIVSGIQAIGMRRPRKS